MNQNELDQYFRSFLNIEAFGADISLNGLQVANGGGEIAKVAFAVDACEETIRRAAELGCGMLFVHHGLFWGREQPITGAHYARIARLIKADVALYACHLPLDANELCGNNYGLAARLGLRQLAPFGEWRGMKAGVIGVAPKPYTLDEVLQKLFPAGEKPRNVLPFGKNEIGKIAIVSGSADGELEQAVAQGADLFITGEVSHPAYHAALESRISVIAGGHYQTETVGVRLVAQKLKAEKGVETVFIDVPTGL